MKAVVFKNEHHMAVEKVPDPKIEDSRDAIIKVTSTAVCGSDLHMYDGRTSMQKGKIFGHEIMGIVKTVGLSVTSIRVGDRVVLPFNISCGSCFNCTRGFTSACLMANRDVIAQK